MFLSKTIFKILHFIYPPRCYLCNTFIDSEGLCFNCFNNLQFSSKYSCDMCGVELKVEGRCLQCLSKPKLFDSLSYCFVYNNEIFKLINKFKNHDQTHMSKFFINFLRKKVIDNNLQDKFDVIIPVPIHYTKLIKRKYNHMCFLSKGIAKHLNKPYINNILKKTKKTKNQIELSGKQRLVNLKGGFTINNRLQKNIKNKNILLIDDVITTGSTINECVKVLKKADCGKIYILSFAKVNGVLKV